jgi:hypothetical protein
MNVRGPRSIQEESFGPKLEKTNRMKRLKWLQILILVFSIAAFAERAPLSAQLTSDSRIVYAPYSDGYISSLDQEIIQPMSELVLVSKPEALREKGSEVVFTSSLHKEFRDRYRDQFGFTEAQQFLNDPVDVQFYGQARGYSIQEEQHRENRRKFGEYVMKRTVEFHADNYFKSDPQLRAVYEVKERLSNLDVKVNETTKLNTNYSFAGNYVTTTLENPYINSQVRLEMAGTTPGAINETQASLYRGITPSTNGEVYYKFNEQKYSLVGRKRFTDKIETSMTYQSSPAETLYLVGFSLLN